MSEKGLILPKNQIIGSKKKKNAGKIIQGVDKVEVKYEEFIEYNQKINEHPEIIDRLVLRDNYVLIRLFKFEEDSKTKGGIIVDDVSLYKTDGGQLRSRVKMVPYQKRGVLVKKASNLNNTDFEKALQPGVIVHVPSNELKPYHLDRTQRVADVTHGYFSVHAGVLDAIELPK